MKLIYLACFYKEDRGYLVDISDLLGYCTQRRKLEGQLVW